MSEFPTLQICSSFCAKQIPNRGLNNFLFNLNLIPLSRTPTSIVDPSSILYPYPKSLKHYPNFFILTNTYSPLYCNILHSNNQTVFTTSATCFFLCLDTVRSNYILLCLDKVQKYQHRIPLFVDYVSNGEIFTFTYLFFCRV